MYSFYVTASFGEFCFYVCILGDFQKYKHNNALEICETKSIPVIQIEDVTVTENIKDDDMVGSVCEAHWTKPDGTKVCYMSSESCILL